MNTFFLIIGVLTVLIAIIDFVWTTLWVDGSAGPLTDRLSSLMWKIMRKSSGDHPKILSMAGPIILSATMVMWILLLWVGWTLVFSGSDNAVIATSDKSPATLVERIYFSGYLIFTLGNGEYAPSSGAWQIATAIATGTGMMAITLGVTYLLSVLNAVTAKRAFAESVLSLGESATEIVGNSWDGTNFHNVNLLLSSFSSQLSMITSQHGAYPILHYYYAENKKEFVPLAVIVLDETLTIFRFGIEEEYRPNRLLIQEMRRTIKSYLETVKVAELADSQKEPPHIDISSLRKDGLPTVTDSEFIHDLEVLSERRQKLAALANMSGVESPWKQRK